MKKRFDPYAVFENLRDKTAETAVFSGNGVSIFIRTQIYTGDVSYVVAYKDNGETAYAVRYTLGEAVMEASSRQVVKC